MRYKYSLLRDWGDGHREALACGLISYRQAIECCIEELEYGALVRDGVRFVIVSDDEKQPEIRFLAKDRSYFNEELLAPVTPPSDKETP